MTKITKVQFSAYKHIITFHTEPDGKIEIHYPDHILGCSDSAVYNFSGKIFKTKLSVKNGKKGLYTIYIDSKKPAKLMFFNNPDLEQHTAPYIVYEEDETDEEELIEILPDTLVINGVKYERVDK